MERPSLPVDTRSTNLQAEHHLSTTSLLLSPHVRPAETDVPISDLLRLRWSPRAFAPDAITDGEIARLFEAARWAPSAYNEQPWSFIVARREDKEAFARLLGCLHPYNQLWAQRAALLAIATTRTQFSLNAEANRTALYDLGQAVACLSVQATLEGLAVHQMVGIEHDVAREVCGVPHPHEVATAFAVGRPGDPSDLSEAHQQREAAPRVRKPIIDFLHAGRWGQTFAR